MDGNNKCPNCGASILRAQGNLGMPSAWYQCGSSRDGDYVPGECKARARANKAEAELVKSAETLAKAMERVRELEEQNRKLKAFGHAVSRRMQGVGYEDCNLLDMYDEAMKG